jgi:uncharacterized protein YdaU (DUF1376 family)
VNYFELHVGDYDAATAHLTMLEDAAYGRMLRIYYRTEKPLPVDVKQVCRLVRAQSKPERDAVQAVLDEFFVLQADGWHQARADAELQRFQAAEPEREQRKANEDARLERHRKERQALFKLLNDNGQHAPWNTKIEELRRLAAPYSNAPATPPATEAVTQPATAPATPATATHGNVSPPPTTHYPVPRGEGEEKAAAVATAAPPAPPLKPADLVAEGVDPQAAADWMALRRAKRLPLTPTAWADTKAEGQKAGLTPPQTVAKAVANNWAGFKAAWLTREAASRGQSSGQPAFDLDGVH